MRFCLYLAHEGLLTERQALQVLSTIVSETPPLGRLVVKDRMMTIAQLRQLLSRQVEVHKPLGMLAVAEGYLTDDQLNRLLRRQQDLTPKSIDVLERLGFLDSEALRSAHRNFVTREG
jgi:hypothetical protein